MRTRIKDNTLAVECHDKIVDTSCTAGTVENAYRTAALVGEYKSMSDIVTGNFKSRSKQGDFIINPMESFKQTVSVSGNGPAFRSVAISCATPVKYAYWYKEGPWDAVYWGLHKATSTYQIPRVLTTLEIDVVTSEAITSCWAASRANQSDFLTDVAEMSQTVAMLKRPFSSIQSYIGTAFRKYKKKYGHDAPSVREAIQGTWLELRYGWRPLVSSVEGITKVALAGRTAPVNTYRGKSSLSRTAVVATGTNDWGSGTVDWQCSVTDKITVRAGVLLENNITVRNSLGIDLGGLLSLPWELVPYSFVADWLANTSTFLKSLGAYATTTPRGSWYVVTRETTATYTCLSTSPLAGQRTVVRSSNTAATVTRVEKTRVVGLPSPSWTLSSNLLEFSNWKHAIDGLFLIAQRFK